MEDKLDLVSNSDPTPAQPKLSTLVQEAVLKTIKMEGFLTFKVRSRLLSSEGGGFMGHLFEVNITGETNSGKKATNLFIKNAIDGDALKKVVVISDLYAQECFAYGRLAKTYEEMQNEVNIPESDRYQFAKYYEHSNNEGIIMENLLRRGFSTYNRMSFPSKKFIELSIQELAKFHALSFVVELRRPEFLYSQMFKRESPFKLNEDWVKLVNNQIRLTIKSVSPELRKRAEEYTQTLVVKYPQYMKDYENTPCCLCHGDYRMSNIMKRETNGVVSDVIPVDYQGIYWGSPIHDIMYFIFSCTDKKFRECHLSNLKNLYYDTFKAFLAYFGIDSEVVFKRLDYEAVFQKRLDFGLMTALMNFGVIFAPDDDLPDVGSCSLDDTDFNLDADTVRRIEELMQDFIEWGFL